MRTLYYWNFECENGYLYVVGEKEYGRIWETSAIERFDTLRDGYRVVTRHSVYFLPWY
jgi:hypothetical protein